MSSLAEILSKPFAALLILIAVAGFISGVCRFERQLIQWSFVVLAGFYIIVLPNLPVQGDDGSMFSRYDINGKLEFIVGKLDWTFWVPQSLVALAVCLGFVMLGRVISKSSGHS